MISCKINIMILRRLGLEDGGLKFIEVVLLTKVDYDFVDILIKVGRVIVIGGQRLLQQTPHVCPVNNVYIRRAGVEYERR